MQKVFATFAILLAALTGPLLAVSQVEPDDGGPLLVIVPPWMDVDELTTAVGAEFASPFSAPMATLIARGDPNLPEQLRNAGAWLVASGTWLSELCGGETAT